MNLITEHASKKSKVINNRIFGGNKTFGSKIKL